jgi:ABC-2 type transport system ATP-binding protein
MIIEVDALAKRFGEIEAVKGVTCRRGAGRDLRLLGPNGAGKTTTINMLCTLLSPTSGSAIVNGFDVRNDRSACGRPRSGLPADHADEYLSAEQNLMFHAYAYGLSAGGARSTDDRAAEHRGPGRLSEGQRAHLLRGMKRRLEIARGLLHHPKVLFLDEPTLALDPQTRRLIWDYRLKLRETEGLTIFLTTHYMDEAEHADRSPSSTTVRSWASIPEWPQARGGRRPGDHFGAG